MIPVTLVLRSRRQQRALAFQKLNHAIPSVGLLAAGFQAVTFGAEGFDLALAVVEIVTSVFLITTIVRSVRAARAQGHAGLHHSHGVDWVDIWAAGVLFAEALERWHLKHHIARPIILTGIVTLGLGVFHGRMTAFRHRRRSLRIDDNGLHVPGRPFRTLKATWPEIADITVTASSAEIRTRAGRRRRLDLRDLENGDAVRAALNEAQAYLKSLPPPSGEPRSA